MSDSLGPPPALAVNGGRSGVNLAWSWIGPVPSRRLLPIAAIVAVVLLLPAPGTATVLGVGALPSPATVPNSNPHTGASHPTSAAALPARAIQPSGPPPASGRGTFFSTSAVPPVAAANLNCARGTCVNVTNDPSVNLTTTGLLAVAYTAYTNLSPCAPARAYALSEVGFVVSANLGASWSAPAYLGNPDCSAPAVSHYPSAWEPSLTSLANGTLVLAYVEYNVSSTFTWLPNVAFGPSVWNVPYDRLVLTESYNGGSSWTTPTVLNSSDNSLLNGAASAPQRPWVTATGDTIYVTWMNWSVDIGTVFNTTLGTSVPVGSGAVHLVVSTDGGTSFSAPRSLRAVGGNGVRFASNPTLALSPTGELFVAYATNFTFHALYACTGPVCLNSAWTAEVEVAASTNNGSTFAYSVAAGRLLSPLPRWGPFRDPSPQLAYGANGELLLTYAAAETLTACPVAVCVFPPSEVYVANSSDNAASWSPSHPVGASLLTSAGFFGTNFLYNPAVGVNATGVVQLEMAYMNFSVCGTGIFRICGAQYELYLNSSDNGATFTAPVLVSDNATPLLYNPNAPDGEYATMVTAGRGLWLGWTVDLCPPWATGAIFSACSIPGAGSIAGVQLSDRYLGPGLSLSFSETGLAVGTHWNVDVMGNLREAAAPANLVVSGIPSGENVTWNLTQNLTIAYGYEFVGGTPSTTPPTILTANLAVTQTYTAEVLLDIQTVPALPAPQYTSTFCFGFTAFSWDYPTCPLINYNMTPAPGATWVIPGTSVTVNLSRNLPYCGAGSTCYSTDWLNLTFLAWTGTGNGSVNSSGTNLSVTVGGPLNETASFQVNGWCAYQYTPVSEVCLTSNSTLLFEERGLPAGLPWSVTTRSGSAVQTNQSTRAVDPVVGASTLGLVNYVVWPIPGPTAGAYWVANSSPASPVTLPPTALVDANFSLLSGSAVSFSSTIFTSGLPAGASWSYTLDGTTYGVSGPSTAPIPLSVGSHTLNASVVDLENGTAYYPSNASVVPLIYNATGANYTRFPATVSLPGPSFVTIRYAPEWWLTVASGVGGSVTPASRWVVRNTTVVLTAMPSPTYTFVNWTGTGPGALNATSPMISVSPLGPVRELATFRPPVPVRWNVTVMEIGIPYSAMYSIAIGNRTFSGSANFTVEGFPTGNYTVAVPYAYANSSALTRYIPTAVSSSFVSVGGGAYAIDSSGSFTVTFATEYLVAISSTGQGTVTPSPGSYWTRNGTTLTITATPSAMYRFAGFTGSGPGSVTSNASSIAPTVNAPISETAEFVVRVPTPPATFVLTVNESGLPPGLLWTVAAGSVGGSNTTATVTIAGLNGSYTFVVGTVYASSGIRYVPTPSGTFPVTVTQNASFSVRFAEQFLLTVTSGAGGTTSPGSGWVSRGASVPILATANVGYVFEGWNGSGPGSYSGSSASGTIIVSGPVEEAAAFAPVSAPRTTGSSTAGASTALALLAGLAVVGVVGGWLLARRPKFPSGGPAEPASGEAPAERVTSEEEPPPYGEAPLDELS